MRTRWIGITGTLLLLTAVTLHIVGPRFFPGAYWGSTTNMMMPGMMGGTGGMMGSMMGGTSGMMGGMMDGQAQADPNRPVDHRFLDQMIVHHQHGVMMTEHMVADSDRAELRDLAQRMITAQQREIEQMRQWRTAWYSAGAMPQEAMMAQMGNAGMMNQDRMSQMMGQTADLDRMFLQMMIPHHDGTIAMAEQALPLMEHPELKTLAQNIVTTQRAEIEEMQRYLKDWYGISE